ncbi:hypothetical protein G352_22196 [Rhodococcus ruber BKS 20-38]|uniref:N-terminal of MaoC-like dehydratase domain-containing protein n=1 Tax=Rhodococcus ruber BKS 20-38 TaxID=1278076 RepID=M2X5B8_9NOCA|nr:hypothetical protein G352_22196 [Rhodococcus ruber BKS 20-38]
MSITTPARRVDRTETPGVGPAREFNALFGWNVAFPAVGATVPLLGHWLYFHDHPVPSQLDEAGLPTESDVLPPAGPGTRRVLGGGRINFRHDLLIGEPAVRSSRLVGTTHRRGRSGELTITTLEHEISQCGRVCLREQQDVIDRSGTGPATLASAVARPGAAGDVPIDAITLFRFSAVMGVAHRIHWDENYAQKVEGYSGLVVPGPLQLIVATHRVRELRKRPIRSMTFRFTSPLTVGDGMVLSCDDTSAQVSDANGRVTCWMRVDG